MNNQLQKQIEALLFYIAEPVEEKELAKILTVTQDEISVALDMLTESLQGRGIMLVRHEGTTLLTTAPEHSALIEAMIKEERERDLGRAGLETLSIIAYKGPVSKKEIEYIRGVNSDYIIRNLLLRGLIEKKTSVENERVPLYTITTDTLLHLGLARIEDIPEYEAAQKKLEVPEENVEENSEEQTNQ